MEEMVTGNIVARIYQDRVWLYWTDPGIADCCHTIAVISGEVTVEPSIESGKTWYITVRLGDKKVAGIFANYIQRGDK